MNNTLRLAASSTLLFILAGCETDNPRGMRGGTADAPMTASGALADPNPKPMDGQVNFFAGQITAEAMLARPDVDWKNPAGPGSEGARRGGPRGGEGAGGFGGGGHRGGGRGMGGRGGGPEGGESPSRVAGESAPRGPAIRASNAPPVQLKLRLTNHGTEAAEIEVLDFNSDLGNFVVQPTKITVPPSESVEADPMTSRLGVPAVDEIPVTVRLRIGGKSGKTETQVLKLRPRQEEPPPKQ